MTLRNRRFVLVLLVSLLGGFVASSLLSYFATRDSLRQQIRESDLPLTSNNVFSEIQRDLLKPVFIASFMARDTFLRDWILAGERDEDAVRRYLAEVNRRYGTVTSFFVSERTRRYYHPSGILKKVDGSDPADTWYFRSARLPAALDYEINVDWDTANPSKLTVFVNHKVQDYDGGVLGVTGVGLSLADVADLLASYQQRYDRQVYFVDSTGRVTLQSGGLGFRSLTEDEAMSAIAPRLLRESEASFVVERGDGVVFLSSRYVPELKWVLVVEQRQGAVGARLLRTLGLNLAISVALTLAMFLLIRWLINAYQRRLELMASEDTLTGALTRQVFDSIYAQVIEQSKRDQTPVSLLILDADNFKALNDTHGHLAGDAGLTHVVDCLRTALRAADSICRWGGDEFVVLLPRCDKAQAMALAERVRLTIEQSPLEYQGRQLVVSVSMGVTRCEPGEALADALARADEGLLSAKRRGRNQVAG
ncbi:MAG: sensor domain-containing diguanylate cyclase [Gammaproteobacteria bacterium]